MRGDNLNARLKSRIRDSGLELTIHYPAVRNVATGTTPGAIPVSPLTGPAPTPTVFPVDATPEKDPVTIDCLWVDMATMSQRDPYKFGQLGVVAGATAVARVLIEDAAEDTTAPLGRTVFTGAERVEFLGTRYRVLAVKPIGASFRAPTTYYVWLGGGA